MSAIEPGSATAESEVADLAPDATWVGVTAAALSASSAARQMGSGEWAAACGILRSITRTAWLKRRRSASSARSHAARALILAARIQGEVGSHHALAAAGGARKALRGR